MGGNNIADFGLTNSEEDLGKQSMEEGYIERLQARFIYHPAFYTLFKANNRFQYHHVSYVDMKYVPSYVAHPLNP